LIENYDVKLPQSRVTWLANVLLGARILTLDSMTVSVTAMAARLDSRPFVATVVALGLGAGAFAQGTPPSPEATAALDAMKRRDQELEAILAAQRKSAETEARLRAEIDAIGEDRRKLNQSLIDTATRVRSIEGRTAVAEQRLVQLDDRENTLRRSLERRRETIAEVLAALQRIGRRPLPAVMARPEDALVSVRTAIMLGAVLPDMKDEAETLVSDIGELVKVRKDIKDERDKLSRDMVSLSEDRLRIGMLGEARTRRQGEVEKQIDTERQRAAELARQANDLKDLIGKLEAQIDSSKRAAQAAARATQQQAKLTQPEQRPNLNALKDPGRLGPAIAFASAKGLLPFPVNGVKIRDFGASDGVGGLEKGLVLATRSGAQVTAPCDGWVVYAGTFRSYGQLLILNAGGGYHVLLAGMERMSVNLGQFVLTGEPVAVMGDGPKVASTIGVASSQPVLYIEFRKDGSPVDPTPWWANNDKQKVRG